VRRSGAATGAAAAPAWRVWVDTGGTFTDCLAVAPDGTLRRAKVLSSGALRGRVAARLGPRRLRLELSGGVPALPDGFFRGFAFAVLGGESGTGEATVVGSRAGKGVSGGVEVTLGRALAAPPGARCELRSPEEAPVLAARLVTATPAGEPLPPLALRLATTRGTNALLERRGAPTALFITRGFADLLAIGTQQRPDLFALEVVKPAPLYAAVVEVDERLDARGEPLVPLTKSTLDALAATARKLRRQGIATAAVALLHAYRNPAHEEAVAEVLTAAGFAHVSRSAELAPLIGIVGRAATAVVDAYLSPVIDDYLDGVAAALPAEATLHVMTSAGGLVRRRDFRARDSLLSGPAGGVVGAARAGRASGLPRVIGFDMGGTSTDVARFDGDFEYLFAHRVGDAELVAPALAIETVAAGGGSICAFDGAALRVGPASAGARPGPACYGAGGPLTLTDVNLLLGRLDPPRFGIPLDEAAAEAAFGELLGRVEAATGGPSDRDAVLAGLLAIADERMAEAIRRVSVRRGYDPADYALVAFGGAGGQHACAVAGLLGVGTVLVPADAGLLSAWGLGAAVVERFAQRQVLAPLSGCGAGLGGWLDELAAAAGSAVAAEGVPAAEVAVRRRIVNLRFVGQEATLAVELAAAGAVDLRTLAARFLAAYQERFGYRPGRRPIEVESLRVIASSRPGGEDGASAAGSETDEAEVGGREGAGRPRGGGGSQRPAGRGALPVGRRSVRPAGKRRAHFGGRWRQVPVFDRDALAPGARLAGPALVFEPHSATVVAPGWRLVVDAAGALRLTAKGKTAGTEPGRFNLNPPRPKRPGSVPAVGAEEQERPAQRPAGSADVVAPTVDPLKRPGSVPAVGAEEQERPAQRPAGSADVVAPTVDPLKRPGSVPAVLGRPTRSNPPLSTAPEAPRA
jgi:5-oxoprolinase (ATP-hydrolysing)